MDNNLPLALVGALREAGYDCWHIAELASAGLADDRIWTLACERRLTVVTKDYDFVRLQARRNPPETPVRWIRLGNCRKPALLDAVIPRLPDILAMFERGSGIVEIC